MIAPNVGNRLPLTNEDTLGPYYPIAFSGENRMDLTTFRPGVVASPEGEPIVVEGLILDRFNRPANGALLEFWQANAGGVYRTPETEALEAIDPWFDGHARCRSADGSFRLRTVKPGPVRGSDGERAPHITLTIFSDGITRLVTQFFFAGEALNAGDPVLLSLPGDVRPRLIAKHHGADATGATVYRFDVILAGARETPFFDDWGS